jgi:hypothetical protein
MGVRGLFVPALMLTASSALAQQAPPPTSSQSVEDRTVISAYQTLGSSIDQMILSRDMKIGVLAKKLADTVEYAQKCGNALGCWKPAVEEKSK